MKKKVLSLLLVAAMGLTMLVGCGGGSDKDTQAGGEAGNKTITVWVADNVVDFTKEQAAAWQKANADYAGYTIDVQPVGEGDAASKMVTDVTGGADVYAFAQDQTARLVAAGALTNLTADEATAVKSANDAGAVVAATVGENIVAYPMTSDNGYFLFYDKSVITDPSTLEGIVKQCETAGKNFYMEINSGWYQPAFFFGAGCELTYETNDKGEFTGANVSYNNENGLKALKAIINLAASSSFQNGSATDKASNYAAIVTGTWEAANLQKVFGDNYACAKLPTYADGVQLGGFSGYKLIGIKPQTDADKLAACRSLAAYLTSEEVQVARYNAVGWGPSNLEAQKDEGVQADAALTALREQQTHMIAQGQYPGDYWTLATALGDDIIGDKLDGKTDAELMEILKTFEDTCKGYATAQ